MAKSHLSGETQWLGIDLGNPKYLEGMCRKIHDGVGAPSRGTTARQMMDVEVPKLYSEGTRKHTSTCDERK